MKSKKKIKTILLVLGIFCVLSTISSYNFYDDQFNSEELVEVRDEIDLKTAAIQDINITTPEEIIYTSPMSGYYPATYGFENDQNGQNPTGWVYNSIIGDAHIVEDFNGHNKVARIFDNNGAFEFWVINYFSSKSNGTVEFWLSSRQDAQDGIAVTLRDGGTIGPFIGIDDGGFYYDEGSGATWLSLSYTADSWHHHRITFNGDTQKYNWSIDNELLGLNIDFFSSISSINEFHIHTGPNWDFSNPIGHFDAVGYSWDEDYEIGDNLYEGLLLSFDHDITPDWLRYSLDGQANKTILGNTTIPMPADGPHTIQVFGNETGTIHKSEIRNFVVSIINIITPENKRYTKPMSGYYPASYGFESDEDGMVPYNWTSSQGTVVDSLDDHNKVLEIDNTDNNIYWADNTFVQQVNGTIEFWLNTTFTGGDPQRIRLMGDTSTIGPDFRIMNDAWQYRVVNTWYTMYQKDGITPMLIYSADTWMHVKIEFECGSVGYKGLSPDTYRVIIDGNSSEDLDFRYTRNWIDTFSVWSGGTLSTIYQIYIDAVGYSWDTNYNLGDNSKEGLLISFDCEIPLDNIAYSLDVQDSVPILGNFTIPMPSDGTHTIQVFGDVYTSQVRPFIVGKYYPPPPPPGDDDDDDDEEEIEFLVSILIIGGISLAIGAIAVAAYLIRKRRIVRE